MLRKFILFVFSGLASICAHGEVEDRSHFTHVDYGLFQLTIPSADLIGARISSLDGPVIRFSNSTSLLGSAATRQLLEVPEEFDLRLYPQYALGIKSTESFSGELRNILDNSLLPFGISAAARVVEAPYKDGMTYSICDDVFCVFFATQDAQDQHILLLNSKGIDREKILDFMGGTNDAF